MTISEFDPALLVTLSKHIASLERSFLEGRTPHVFDLHDIFADSEQTFFSVQGLADFWNARAGTDFAQHMTDLVTGAHNQRQEGLTMVLAGTPRKLSLFVSLGTALTTKTMLEGILPGIHLQPVSAIQIERMLEMHFLSQGILTGIPTRKSSSPQSQALQHQQQKSGENEQDTTSREGMTQEGLQIERVISGMEGATWGYIVQAHPRPRSVVAELRLKTIDLLAQIASNARLQVQTTQQDSRQLTPIMSGSQTQTSSSEVVNYRAQYLTRLLERELSRMDQATASGQWTVRTYLGADNEDDAQRLASLLVGTLAGKDSRPDPLRALHCQRNGLVISAFNTFLSSDEVATLIQFPREEVPGYAIHDFIRFDVDFQSPASDTLALGHIQHNNRDLQDTYNISLNALAKHAVVVGVTGSGKTTTVMNLLDRMVEARKPFLVIEPAKTEYRALRSTLSDRADFRVYTLGNETIAPFRLNPFEFETDDEPGSASVLTHIDFLKAVFNASFVLYAPMPHVLEMALHEVYEDKGWDLASGLNIRIPDWQVRQRYPIFPTLTDLYLKVEVVTNRLGYHDEVERNVKAGLKARIGSLRLGSKGLMLDTVRGIPMQRLLSAPTILEMEGIGSDEEKTFVMGLFLARLYEYRRLQAATGVLPEGLQHLLVFEEAHRLLKNTPTQVDSESSNMRAQAVEVFTNMLSEVRAYGQGVLVAEQIPSKLAPDVLKNTNMKIVHRLIAQDDRQSVGQTMNLNAQQMRHLGILAPGIAAIYAEGADHAYLVHLENYKRKLSTVRDVQLKAISPGYASVCDCQEILDLAAYQVPLTPFGGPDPLLYQMVEKVVATPRSTWLWGSIFLRIQQHIDTLPEMLDRLSEHIEAEMLHLPAVKQHDIARMVILRACSLLMQQRGAQSSWTYPQTDELRIALTHGLLTLLHNSELARARVQLAQFAEMYKARSTIRQGPFIGCMHCRHKCQFRAEVVTLLSLKDIERIDRELTSENYTTLEARYASVAVVVTGIADRWLGGSETIAADIGYCAALYAITQQDYTDYEQSLIADSLVPYLLE